MPLKSFTCEHCQQPFERYEYPSSRKNGQSFKYCSHKCSYQAKRILPDKVCPVCKKIFAPRKNKHLKYCSRKCSYIGSKNLNLIIKRKCLYCEKEFEIYKAKTKRNRGQYCSKKCMTEARKDPRAYVNKKCLNCNKEITVLKSQVKHRNGGQFCSNDCRFEYCKGKNHPVWKHGKHPFYYGKNWGNQRKKALKRDKYQCQVCKRDNIKLDVHHIIPFYKFDGNYKLANKVENLITLCCKCHPSVECNKIPCPKPKSKSLAMAPY